MKFVFGYHPYYEAKKRIQDQFVCHTLNAFSVEDGKQAGYIKISYIPSGIFEESIIPYLSLHGFILDDINEYSEDELLYRSAWHLIVKVYTWHEANDILKEVQSLGVHEGSQKIRQDVLPKIEKKFEREWKTDIKYHVDSPKVDFIRVHVPYRSQGLAEQLYYNAAKWMKNSFGLKMRFSTLQSSAAKKVMQRFIKHDMVTVEKFKEKWEFNWINVDKPLWLDNSN